MACSSVRGKNTKIILIHLNDMKIPQQVLNHPPSSDRIFACLLLNVDKYENFEKKRHFGSFNIFLGIQLRDMTVKCQNRVDNGMGYTFQQQWESTKLKILSWTGVNIAKNTVF